VVQPKLLHLIAQSIAADIEQLRGVRLVSVRLAQRQRTRSSSSTIRMVARVMRLIEEIRTKRSRHLSEPTE